ncbi:hypothetical protein TDB9533_00140 [Thalassocella blandensis]|nr:hypothetical protein TDB9533_00140 [Thalassocella blandensis]
MAENITRCPKCKTSFRISDAHLRSAKGAVRCGSCLNIFNAKEHLISSHQEAPETPVKTPPAKTTPAKVANVNKAAAQPATKQPSPSKTVAKTARQEVKPSSEDATTTKPKPASTFAKAIANKTEKQATQKKPANTASPSKVNASSSSHSDEDDMLISDDMDNRNGSRYDDSFNTEEDYNESELGRSNTGQYDVNLFERALEDEDNDDASDSDESWALDLLNEDNDPPPPPPTQKELEEEEERRITQEFEASFNFDHSKESVQDTTESQESFDFDDYPDSEDSGFATGEFDAVDPHTSKDSGASDFDEPHSQESGEHFAVGYDDGYDDGYDAGYDSTASKKDQQTFDDADEGYDVGYTNSFEDDYEDEDEKNVLKDDPEESYPESIDNIKESYFEEEENYEEAYEPDAHNKQPFEKENTNYLDSIEPEPVEFSFKRHSNFWQSNILWGTLAIAGGIALFIQIATIKFDSLSLVEPYRSYYGIACKYANCTLPELVNRSKIRTANLVVRSHPKIKNALIVDAVLQNTAKFEQTFPTLDLVFTDSREKPVSARRLSPSEYLRGELAGRTNMPVKQPVHIAIEISDPGPEAVGYRISIVD